MDKRENYFMKERSRLLEERGDRNSLDSTAEQGNQSVINLESMLLSRPTY